MKLLTIIFLCLPLFASPQENSSDTGLVYSRLWGKKGELWNKKQLPDFTHAGYRENRVAIPVFSVTVNILDFGGKGDGITDNTRALRAAIQQCGSKGTIYIPSGNYLFKDTIVIRKSGICIRGAGTTATTLFFEKGLEELYPDYGIHYPKQSSWSWSGAMILFCGPLSESGIEQLSIRFPDQPWAGHTYDEKGYNAIGFSSGANNNWVRHIRFVGADMGIWIDSTSHHITAEHWALDFEAIRGAQPLSGHHGINITGSYNLLQDFELKGKYQHDLSVETSGAKYNVFRNGKGKDLAIDHHNHEQAYNLFTALDAGLGTRLYFSGGISTPRGICFKETYWNITAVNNMKYCDQHNDPSKQSANNICVGIKTLRAAEMNDQHHNWFETIPPEKLFPQDLYQAQMKFYGYKQ